MQASGKTNVPDNAHETTSGDQHSETMLPDFVKFVVEPIVIRNQTQLGTILRILFESPVGR